mgnify:FL=1
MENDQNPLETPQNSDVGVVNPIQVPSQKDSKALIIIIIIILFLLGVGGFLIFRGGNKESLPSPTPGSEVQGEQTELTPSPTPKEIDKSKIEILVQNGTGISGEAGLLATQLKSLGYTNVKTGNAETQDASITTVTFKNSLEEEVVNEITKKLESMYKEVKSKKSSSIDQGVLIITGLRKGVTAKPSASPTPKASSSPKPSASPTGSPSASPTSSPTPTP